MFWILLIIKLASNHVRNNVCMYIPDCIAMYSRFVFDSGDFVVFDARLSLLARPRVFLWTHKSCLELMNACCTCSVAAAVQNCLQLECRPLTHVQSCRLLFWGRCSIPTECVVWRQDIQAMLAADRPIVLAAVRGSCWRRAGVTDRRCAFACLSVRTAWNKTLSDI